MVQGAKDGANISVRDALGWKEEIRHGPQAARAAGRSDRARGYDTEGDNVLTHVHAVNVKLLPDSKRHVLVAARDSHGLATDVHRRTAVLLERTIQAGAPCLDDSPNLSSRARPALEPQKAGTNRSQPITLLQYLYELGARRGARPLFLRARRRCQGKDQRQNLQSGAQEHSSLLGPSGERLTAGV